MTVGSDFFKLLPLKKAVPRVQYHSTDRGQSRNLLLSFFENITASLVLKEAESFQQTSKQLKVRFGSSGHHH